MLLQYILVYMKLHCGRWHTGQLGLVALVEPTSHVRSYPVLELLCCKCNPWPTAKLQFHSIAVVVAAITGVSFVMLKMDFCLFVETLKHWGLQKSVCTQETDKSLTRILTEKIQDLLKSKLREQVKLLSKQTGQVSRR